MMQTINQGAAILHKQASNSNDEISLQVLITIAKELDISIDVAKLEALQTETVDHFQLRNIVSFAQKIGLKANMVTVSFSEISKKSLPIVILHIETNTCYVIRSVNEKGIAIINPSSGRISMCPVSYLRTHFASEAVLISKPSHRKTPSNNQGSLFSFSSILKQVKKNNLRTMSCSSVKSLITPIKES